MTAMVHYEIEESQVGDAIRIKAISFRAVDGKGPPPPKQWLTTSPDGIPCVGDYLASYMGSHPSVEYVHAPNWLAELFGDTLEKRLVRARARVSRWAEREKTKQMMIYRKLQAALR